MYRCQLHQTLATMFHGPCCLVCGATVFQGDWDYIFSEKLKWKKQWEEQKQKGRLFCKASEVEDRYFTKKCSNQWEGLYRLSMLTIHIHGPADRISYLQ